MASLRLDVITDDAGFDALRSAWERVLVRSSDRSVFLTWEWARTWWRHYGRRDRLHIVTVSDGADVVAIAPLLRTGIRYGKVGITMLVGIGQENADYGGMLLGPRPREAADLILGSLESEIRDGPVVLNLTRLRPEGDLLRIVGERFGSGTAGTDNSDITLARAQQSIYPYLDLSTVDDPARYVAKLDTKNDSRRCLRRFREAHDVTFEYDVEPTTDAMRTLLDLYERRWAEKPGTASGVFASDRGRAFISEAASLLHAEGRAKLSFLSADGAAVGGRFGFEFEGAYLGFMETFEPDFGRYGPGQILVAQILAAAVERGLHEFDFMRGEGLHKSKWANSAREVDYWVAHRRGRLGQLHRRLMWNLMRLRVRNSVR